MYDRVWKFQLKANNTMKGRNETKSRKLHWKSINLLYLLGKFISVNNKENFFLLFGSNEYTDSFYLSSHYIVFVLKVSQTQSISYWMVKFFCIPLSVFHLRVNSIFFIIAVWKIEIRPSEYKFFFYFFILLIPLTFTIFNGLAYGAARLHTDKPR